MTQKDNISVDPFSAEALEAPTPFYDSLREQCPVAHVSGDNSEFYIISGYDRVRQVMKDHQQWTKKDGSFLFKGDSSIALNQDLPEFEDFRSVYINYMGQQGVKRWQEDIKRFAHELIDGFYTLGKGDFHDLFAMPLPMRAMALILGIPQDNLNQYKIWSDTFMTKGFNQPNEVQAAIEQLYGFFDQQIGQRRDLLQGAHIDEPSNEQLGTVLPDDLISNLLVAKYQGRYLTDAELRRTIRGFFIGGNKTTTWLILNLLSRLNEVPDRWQLLISKPELIPNAIEESLRCDPPTLGMFRGARCPVTMEGVSIAQDERVMFSIHSANHDPAVFEKPTEFIIDRPMADLRKHVTFSYGAHFCLGAWLSRMEAKIAMEIIIERLPNLRVTGPGERIEPFCFWGLKSLPVTW